MLHVHPKRQIDALWTIEEAVGSGAVSAIIGEVDEIDFTASRRLRLASIKTGIPVILLSSYRREGATAACARWRIRPAPSAANPFDPFAPGAPRWQATVERCRIAPCVVGTSFKVECDDETLSLRLVSRMADHATTARPKGHPPPNQIFLQKAG